MIIEGTFTINAPLQEVWDFLSDLPRMSACVPGAEGVEQSDPLNYAGTITVKVGPVATSFQGKVTKTLEQAPHLLKARLQGRDQKTASLVSGEFSSELVSQSERVTEVSYKFDIALRGRLGQFGQAVILDTSRQLTDEFVRCVKARIERPQAPLEQSAPQADVAAAAWRAFLNNLRPQLEALWDRLRGLFRAG